MLNNGLLQHSSHSEATTTGRISMDQGTHSLALNEQDMKALTYLAHVV